MLYWFALLFALGSIHGVAAGVYVVAPFLLNRKRKRLRPSKDGWEETASGPEIDSIVRDLVSSTREGRKLQ